MSYDEGLAERIRMALDRRKGVIEKKMFGGLTFLLDGKMLCGVVGEDLMVRVGPKRYADALTKPHIRPMDFTRLPLRGFVYVGSAGHASESSVESWVSEGIDFVKTLPSKER